MDTHKNSSLNKFVYFVLMCATLNLSAQVSSTSTITTSQKCTFDDQISQVAVQEISPDITSLEKILADCTESSQCLKVKYQLGLANFKAHMMNTAKAQFLQVAKEPNCPEPMRFCSLNMIGQISRLTGENKESLEAFDQLLHLAEQSSNGSDYNTNPVLTKLACYAVLGRAEIYDLKQAVSSSVAEYERLLRLLSRGNNIDLLNYYKPFITDRISQLYLRHGDFKGYSASAKTVFTSYPEYYRTPLVRFEFECVSLLKNIDATSTFPNGSFDSPAQVITYFRNSKDRTRALPIISTLCEFCEEYRNTYGGAILQYHYAWLLDTFNEKDKAAEIFKQVFSTNIPDSNKLERKAIIETVQNYARIQYAIMLKEKGDYKRALQTLDNLQTQSDESHLIKLAKSVSQSIQTCQREVPKNESK
jgi:tetratricopeptide (TPR) repeat protein